MVLPILAKVASSALVKKSQDAKKESKKTSQPKLAKANLSLSKKVTKQPGALVPRKFIPQKKSGSKSKSKNLDALLSTLVTNTEDLKKITDKDAKDEKRKAQKKKEETTKLKVKGREEKTDKTRAVAQLKLAPKVPQMDFLKQLIAGVGRFAIGIGIVELLKFFTDPEKKEGFFQFFRTHFDKIVIGLLATIGAVFLKSFLPLIGFVGKLLSFVLKPILMGLLKFMANPAFLALLGIGYAAMKQGLGKQEQETLRQLEEQLSEEDRKDPKKVLSVQNRAKLIKKLREQKANLNPLQIIQGVGNEIDEQISFLETLKFGHGKKIFGKEGLDLGLPFDYDTGGSIDPGTGEASGGFTLPKPEPSTNTSVSTPRTDRPDRDERAQVSPQTPMMGDAYGTGLQTGPSQFIGGSSDYHIDTKLSSSLSMDEKIAMMDKLARQYESQGRVIEFSNTAVANERYTSDMSTEEKRALLQRAFAAHNLPRGRAIDQGGFNSLDYYIPLRKDSDETGGRGRFRSSAEGAEIFVPVPEGGSLEYHTGGRYGNFVVILDKNGNVVGKTGHGDTRFGRKSGTVQFGEQKPKDQNVSFQAPYEKSGTQFAMIQVPMPVPMGNQQISEQGRPSMSDSGGNVNSYAQTIALAKHYSQA